MEFQISYQILTQLVFIFTFCGLSKQDEHSVKDSLCEFEIVNRDDVKRTFEYLTKLDNVWLINFDITILPETFITTTGFDNKQKNGIQRWIWVPRKHSYILSYPLDLDVVTFQLSQNVVKNISVNANASFLLKDSKLDDLYFMCIESLYDAILENILHANKTNWLFCNRYFDGQYYKNVLYELTGSWLGYDFICFDSFHLTQDSATYIKKGTVNVAINIFIMILCLYLPLLYLLLPYRYNTCLEDVQFYRKGEYPNSLARLTLRLHDVSKQKIKEINSVEEWFEQFDINQFKPEIHVFSLLYIITLSTYSFGNQYIKILIPDYNYFPEFFKSWNSDINLCWDTLLFTISFFVNIPLFIIAMSFFSQSNSIYVSLNPFGRIHVKDVLTSIEEEENMYVGYTKFALKFLHRIDLFFSFNLWATSFNFVYKYEKDLPWYSQLCNIVISIFVFIGNFCLYVVFLLIPINYFLLDCFVVFPFRFIMFMHKNDSKKENNLRNLTMYYSFSYILFVVYAIFCVRPYFLFVVQFIFRSIIYVFFVACPLFVNISETASLFLICVLSILIYAVKYTSAFHKNYKRLLDKLLQIKREFDQKSKQNNVNMVNGVEHSKDAERISVQNFDKIAEKYLPLRHQLLLFFLKITLTTLFLYVTFDTINLGDNDKISSSLLPIILTAAIPALLEKFCSPFNIEETLKFNADEIETDFLKEYTNCTSEPQNEANNEGLVIWCPIFYSLKVFKDFISNAIFNFKKSKPILAQPCCPNKKKCKLVKCLFRLNLIKQLYLNKRFLVFFLVCFVLPVTCVIYMFRE